jgi:hypothetical protein
MCAIYKNKGERDDINNYRPLSIPTAFCRLWSYIMNARLISATAHIMPDTMFGFRPGRTCLDPVFIIRHLVDMHKAKQGGIVGAAFMDLSGAYDSVDRELLFNKLASMGATPQTIAVLRSLYTDNQINASSSARPALHSPSL